MKVKKAIAAIALTAGVATATGVATAPPASAHQGASGVVAVHNGPSGYQELVLGKSTTHSLAYSPMHAANYVAVVRAAGVFSPIAVAYWASALYRAQQAERSGECFSLVRPTWGMGYFPARTSQGCR